MNTLASIELPPGIRWSNQHEASGVRAQVELALNGSPLIWEGAQGGRLIRLQGGPDFGWIQRSTLITLINLVQPGAEYALSWNGEDKTVRWATENAPCISAEPVIDYAEPADDDMFMNLELILMEL